MKRKERSPANKNRSKIRKVVDQKVPEDVIVPAVRNSDDVIPKKVKWINKTRVLIFSARGITYRDRHLMENLRTLMPHSKPEVKKNNKTDLEEINEIAEMKNCSKVLYFDPKRKRDLYLWMVNVTRGPSVKFLVQNVHTMEELKLTGNCLKGCRPILTFDMNFNEPYWQLIKELLIQIFDVPKGHPKSQPFFDKVYSFCIVDHKIWFRNYQIVEEDGQLTEIGPRFVLNPIKIFDGSFGGVTIWSNPHFVTPTNIRALKKQSESGKYRDTVAQKIQKTKRLEGLSFIGDPTSDFYETVTAEESKEKQNEVSVKKDTKKKKKKKKKAKRLITNNKNVQYMLFYFS